MRVLILGSAAGGGVPQWNCRCPVCTLAWRGGPQVRPRSQSSLAVSADGLAWVLINASPDLRQQILDTPALQPQGALRRSPIASVVLTNGDVDHIAGLLTLREGHPFTLFGTEATLAQVQPGSVFGVLDPAKVVRIPFELDAAFSPAPGLRIEAFAVPGKVPLYLERGPVETGTETEATVGLKITTDGARLLHVPGCARLTPKLLDRIAGADLLLFDGTLFADDEMITLGMGEKTGQRMGHVAVSGPGGSLEGLAAVPVARKAYVHINNTNPILVEDSPERALVEQAGWMVAHDGMEFVL